MTEYVSLLANHLITLKLDETFTRSNHLVFDCRIIFVKALKIRNEKTAQFRCHFHLKLSVELKFISFIVTVHLKVLDLVFSIFVVVFVYICIIFLLQANMREETHESHFGRHHSCRPSSEAFGTLTFPGSKSKTANVIQMFALYLIFILVLVF